MNGKWGYINHSKRVLIRPAFDQIANEYKHGRILGSVATTLLLYFHEGLARVGNATEFQ